MFFLLTEMREEMKMRDELFRVELRWRDETLAAKNKIREENLAAILHRGMRNGEKSYQRGTRH